MGGKVSGSNLWAVMHGEPEDIASIGASMSKMRMMIGRRIIGRMAIASVAPDLELSHLDVIEAVRRRSEEGEATVGSIAEAMRIDPSRGSRLVAELVKRGVLRRAVSQEDARRTVVELTDSGQEMIRAFQSVKAKLLHNILDDWPAEDVVRFADLFGRFVEGMHAHMRLTEQEPSDK
ncbi:MarR family transcriptional regulator [Pseudomonas sp. R2.Fl]|nr:MarR family transcriptional regulator [Pseudomonas sp. R2.Fl]